MGPFKPWQISLKKGYSFDIGLGVRRNLNKAERYYLQAAAHGSTAAQYNLGQLYHEKGRKTWSKAIVWWKRAASNGHPLAQCNLGKAYDYGKGVRKDRRKAKELYGAAAANGDSIALYNLAILLDLEGQTSEAKKAFKAVVSGLRVTSRKRNASAVDAKVCLARCFYNGWGTSVNKLQALKWYRLAAKSNDKEALHELAQMYSRGDGVKKNEKKAAHILANTSTNRLVV